MKNIDLDLPVVHKNMFRVDFGLVPFPIRVHQLVHPYSESVGSSKQLGNRNSMGLCPIILMGDNGLIRKKKI